MRGPLKFVFAAVVVILHTLDAEASTLNVRMIEIMRPIPISTKEITPNGKSNQAYFVEGKPSLGYYRNRPFCIVAVDSRRNKGLLRSGQITPVVKEDHGIYDPRIDTLDHRDRTIFLHFNHPLLRNISCNGLMAEGPKYPTIEQARQALGSYIKLYEGPVPSRRPRSP